MVGNPDESGRMADPGARWVSYNDLAAARGISRLSAERLVRKRRYPKQKANDGTVRVLVPPEDLELQSDARPERRPDDRSDVVDAIRSHLAREVARADAAEARAERAEVRADRAEADARAARAEAQEARQAVADIRAADADRASAGLWLRIWRAMRGR